MITRFVKDVVGNIIFTLFCWIFPRRVPALRANPAHVSAALATALGAVAAMDIITQWPVDQFEIWGLSAAMSWLFVVIAALVFGLIITRRAQLIAPALVITGNGLALGLLLRWGLISACQGCFNWNHWSGWASYGTLVLIPVGFGLWHLFGSGWRSLARFVPVACIMLVAVAGNSFLLPHYPMFQRDYSEADGDTSYSRVDIEKLYYAQARMMAAQTETLRTHTPGQTDIYALSLGGYAEQMVFLREAEAVAGILQSNYDAKGQTITLVNSRVRPFQHPLANLPNISDALGAMAARMDVDEDIAFVFLTSHGSKEEFSLSFYEAGINQLTPDGLAAAIEAAGLRYVVILLSACHSGSFVDALRHEDRLIMTASASDRNSFGCSNENEWTWWGRAYFHEALGETLDFRDAFERASTYVAAWEQESGNTPSHPQIALGDGMNRKLDHLFSDPETASRFSIAHRQSLATRIGTTLERFAKRNGVEAGGEGTH